MPKASNARSSEPSTVQKMPPHANADRFGKSTTANLDREMDAVVCQYDGFPDRIDCWSCGQSIPRDCREVAWPVGRDLIVVPDVISYHCERCGVTYHPEPILDVVAEGVRSAWQHLENELGRPNKETHPSVVAFNRLRR